MRRLAEFFSHRLWGFIPLLLFALKCWQYRNPADQYQLIWFCNAANLLLGIALLARWKNLIFVCTTLLLIGLPIWIFDFIVNGDFHVVSIFTHVLSPLLGTIAALRLGCTQHVIWQTLVFYLLLQLLARLTTPASLNINVAYDVYAPVKPIFGNFAVYSMANLTGLLGWTWIAHRLLRLRFLRQPAVR